MFPGTTEVSVGLNGSQSIAVGDFNNDGLPDVVTGWEESGLVRLYVNPGPQQCKSAWPVATIATAASPEDAVILRPRGGATLQQLVTAMELLRDAGHARLVLVE